MLQFIRNLFTAASDEADRAEIPAGQRVYAVGDIHGRLDLFDALAEAIERDDAVQGPADTTVVLLGDLVDRGPDSRGVIEAARWWQERRRVRILFGNHEEMMLRAMHSTETLRVFLRHGGKQTLHSFGVDRRALASATIEEVQAMMWRAVSPSVIAYLEGFEDRIAIGDYLFVHAGIDPAAPLDAQKESDLRWIREPFLSHPDPYGVVVVHGHTISEAPEDRGNRIGIDTGAYASGRLTALVLEGSSRRFIVASETDGVISTSQYEQA